MLRKERISSYRRESCLSALSCTGYAHRDSSRWRKKNDRGKYPYLFTAMSVLRCPRALVLIKATILSRCFVASVMMRTSDTDKITSIGSNDSCSTDRERRSESRAITLFEKGSIEFDYEYHELIICTRMIFSANSSRTGSDVFPNVLHFRLFTDFLIGRRRRTLPCMR